MNKAEIYTDVCLGKYSCRGHHSTSGATAICVIECILMLAAAALRHATPRHATPVRYRRQIDPVRFHLMLVIIGILLRDLNVIASR